MTYTKSELLNGNEFSWHITGELPDHMFGGNLEQYFMKI
jgi:hypothetical protein